MTFTNLNLPFVASRACDHEHLDESVRMIGATLTFTSENLPDHVPPGFFAFVKIIFHVSRFTASIRILFYGARDWGAFGGFARQLRLPLRNVHNLSKGNLTLHNPE